jgi:dTDP-4-dehydrorhamnose 3,5-epimerase
MNITESPLKGLLIIEPSVFQDERGSFFEIYNEERYKSVGILENFLQDNHSRSTKDVLRGMHFQIDKPYSQIVTLLTGKIFDVCVDLRKKSSTFGQWFGIELKEFGVRQIYHPPGFAHGYCVLSEFAELHYKVSEHYNPNYERGLNWNDCEVGIKWPLENPKISQRDLQFPKLSEILIDLF